ncbi:DNA-binding GntR family transcriptional regulator [Scopulibacillus darangshiensis]|uniref:DNA-binding GntR family transcriptional regulator n=1 Tax=Scopulibacillus darangshiensis TaxID=442528 RepID=A0A4R2P954_9BACL|nr:GntR family transcriptional regulator [Scopulibacillus darangshiensis]TCP30868.1 DNA-binding GntR family transcriptional regulator [Scopulibacillus darangshiensis]
MTQIDLSNNSLSNQIAERITEQIIKGELKPGDKLVESMYAEEFGISRAPIREAFLLLTIEGLVEKIPRKGTVVKGYTELEIYDLLKIRMNLESLAVERITEQGADSAIISKMEDLLKLMQNEKGTSHYARLNQSFHQCIIEMSKSKVIKDMYARLGLPLLSIQHVSFSREGNIEKSIKEHSLLINYLKNNQMTKLSELLYKHNNDVLIGIKEKLHN